MFNNFFLKLVPFMWKKYSKAQQATNDNIKRRMGFACWIPKATKAHSEYAILIAFPLQQWLHESASMWHLYARKGHVISGLVLKHRHQEDTRGHRGT
jgi:hypothetical protein